MEYKASTITLFDIIINSIISWILNFYWQGRNIWSRNYFILITEAWWILNILESSQVLTLYLMTAHISEVKSEKPKNPSLCGENVCNNFRNKSITSIKADCVKVWKASAKAVSRLQPVSSTLNSLPSYNLVLTIALEHKPTSVVTVARISLKNVVIYKMGRFSHKVWFSKPHSTILIIPT